MADLFESHSRSARLDHVLRDLLGRAPELQAASVVSFDGLPMASALPSGMDEDRVAAMSAALLSLGERAAENFGRGSLNQVYVEGENGTVFLVSADDEAVLVAVGAKGAKVGLLMFEVRRSAVSVAEALRADDAAEAARTDAVAEPEWPEPVVEPAPEPVAVYEPVESYEPVEAYEPEPVGVEPVAVAPALHVVDGGHDEPDEDEVVADEAGQSYEPTEPYATPYAEELPPPAPSPWGTPLTAVSQPEQPGRDPNHWTSYDQTDRDGGWA
jgi:predicted regulator of Ras-like GTPase activity (Roadblock/LC7/MglB family)